MRRYSLQVEAISATENIIVGIHVGLTGICIAGMERMSHLMGQSEDIVQIALIIQQNIRMYAVNTGGISAAPFALIFINIDPAVVETFS